MSKLAGYKATPRLIPEESAVSDITTRDLRACYEHTSRSHCSYAYKWHLAITLSREINRKTRLGISRVQKFEWLEAYSVARPLAVWSQNIDGGFKQASLRPFAPSAVLRQLPTIEPVQLSGSEQLLHADSPPKAMQLQQANKAVLKAVDKSKDLKSPTKRFIQASLETNERLMMQLAISRKGNKDREKLLQQRQEKNTGKRCVLKDQILLTTQAIRDEVLAAEEESKTRKNKKGKHKAQVIPEEIIEEVGSDEEVE